MYNTLLDAARDELSGLVRRAEQAEQERDALTSQVRHLEHRHEATCADLAAFNLRYDALEAQTQRLRELLRDIRSFHRTYSGLSAAWHWDEIEERIDAALGAAGETQP